MPEARPPRDDDELFSQIVEREFHEKVAPTRPPRDAATPPAPPPPPAPFELNLFDDDESYRDAPRLDGMTRLTGLARVGIILLAVSVVGGMLMGIGVGAPGWVGWLVAAAFAVAVGIGIRQMLRRPGDHDDEDGVV